MAAVAPRGGRRVRGSAGSRKDSLSCPGGCSWNCRGKGIDGTPGHGRGSGAGAASDGSVEKKWNQSSTFTLSREVIAEFQFLVSILMLLFLHFNYRFIKQRCFIYVGSHFITEIN